MPLAAIHNRANNPDICTKVVSPSAMTSCVLPISYKYNQTCVYLLLLVVLPFTLINANFSGSSISIFLHTLKMFFIISSAA